MLCGCGSTTTPTTNQDITLTGSLITVAEQAPVLAKIKIEPVHSAPYNAQFSSSGVVKAIPTSYAEVAAPFAGRIVRSFVRLGQSVVPGTPLFEISSSTFFEAGKAYFGAKQEMEQALRAMNREKDLLANNVGVAKEAEQAQVDYTLKRQEYENAKSALEIFQVVPEDMTLGEPLVVRSPIAGKVVANNIIIGQYIKEDAAPMAIVADLRKVWVVANVKEKDIRQLEKLQQVEIRLSASPDEVITGTIFHVSDMLDQATRAVEVIIECDNASGKMKPFMYGTVLLTDQTTQAILIPTASVLQQQDECYVLVAEGSRSFRRRAITVATTLDNRSVVTGGINPGESIVTEGAFYLLDAK